MKTTIKNFITHGAMFATICIFFINISTVSCSKPENGKDGATGTANVIYSNWQNVVFTQNGSQWLGTITAPKITQEILDQGTVLVYYKDQGNVILFNSSVFANYFNIGIINLVSGISINIPLPFRYIIIPGGVSSANKSVNTQPNFSNMTYKQVCASLNIPE